MVTKKKQPRGIRNNNPLNIRIGNVWLGEVKDPTDTEYEQFCTMEYGLRAAFVLMRRYIRRYHLNTVTAIVSRWAPSNENNTQAYIKSVCALMKCDPDTQLLYEDAPTMCKLVQAMAKVECGVIVDIKRIEKGYQMA